ncbi:hypothetical protein [Planobispora longispora]|uniref:Uncharacterized protein n=1 Tax=Planobispora longispora TaxID=28887 RepID=A0A8J3RWD8_9ACTN|nr:hypothetical protein [Planobispora longispora]GIH81177.1 hypothetical protein Plo01_76060 [Planobispora longispora]
MTINETSGGQLVYAEIRIAEDSGTDPELVAAMDQTAGHWREIPMAMGDPDKRL